MAPSPTQSWSIISRTQPRDGSTTVPNSSMTFVPVSTQDANPLLIITSIVGVTVTCTLIITTVAVAAILRRRLKSRSQKHYTDNKPSADGKPAVCELELKAAKAHHDASDRTYETVSCSIVQRGVGPDLPCEAVNVLYNISHEDGIVPEDNVAYCTVKLEDNVAYGVVTASL